MRNPYFRQLGLRLNIYLNRKFYVDMIYLEFFRLWKYTIINFLKLKDKRGIYSTLQLFNFYCDSRFNVLAFNSIEKIPALCIAVPQKHTYTINCLLNFN